MKRLAVLPYAKYAEEEEDESGDYLYRIGDEETLRLYQLVVLVHRPITTCDLCASCSRWIQLGDFFRVSQDHHIVFTGEWHDELAADASELYITSGFVSSTRFYVVDRLVFPPYLVIPHLYISAPVHIIVVGRAIVSPRQRR